MEKILTHMSITYNVALITVDNLPVNMGLISRILNDIGENHINVDMISQAPPFRGSINLSFTMHTDDLVKAISILKRYKREHPGLQIEVDAYNTKISVFGEEMKNLPGVAAHLFATLANYGVDIKLVTTSEVDISYLIYEKDVDKALEAIRSKYALQPPVS